MPQQREWVEAQPGRVGYWRKRRGQAQPQQPQLSTTFVTRVERDETRTLLYGVGPDEFYKVIGDPDLAIVPGDKIEYSEVGMNFGRFERLVEKAKDSYLWGLHRITGRWERLQGPCDRPTLQQYQAHFAKTTLQDSYSHVPFSGFSRDTRPTYQEFRIADKAPRKSSR